MAEPIKKAAGHKPAQKPVIETFVFIDLETTGIPGMELDPTRIIELCCIAVSRAAILNASNTSEIAPDIQKLSFLANPGRKLAAIVKRLTGIKDKELFKSKTFPEEFDSLLNFIESLPEPRCLLAHNGNKFDFKILQAECKMSQRELPQSLQCLDTLVSFRKLDKLKLKNLKKAPTPSLEVVLSENDQTRPGTDTAEQIDDICQHMSDISTDPDSPQKPKKSKVTRMTRSTMPRKILQDARDTEINNIFAATLESNTRKSFKLVELYERLVGKVPVKAHRAEVDCMMMLECVLVEKDDFLQLADKEYKPLSGIIPSRYY